MALTRDYKHTIVQRVQMDSAFAQALINEANKLFLNGDREVADLLVEEATRQIDRHSNRFAVSNIGGALG